MDQRVITPQPGDLVLLDEDAALWGDDDGSLAHALIDDVERVVICLESYELPLRVHPPDPELASPCARVWFDGVAYWIYRRHIKAIISSALVAQPGRAAC